MKTQKEIALENLCYYDTRNPDCILDEDEIKERKKRKPNCSCDNCFYDRAKLAEIILNLIEK